MFAKPVRARDVSHRDRLHWTPDEQLAVVWVGVLGGMVALLLIYGMVITS